VLGYGWEEDRKWDGMSWEVCEGERESWEGWRGEKRNGRKRFKSYNQYHRQANVCL
jgi:hypothetical protein